MTESKRNVTIDIVRFLAAFGVIAIHVPFNTLAAKNETNFFLPLCVPFFFIISLTYFISGLNQKKTIAEVLTKTWLRIIIPYLAWTAIYFVLMEFKRHFIGLGHSVNTPVSFWQILFYGTSAVQLYYLPKLAAMQAIAFSVYILFRGDKSKVNWAMLILLIAAGYFAWGEITGVFPRSDIPNTIVYLAAATFFSNKIKRHSFSGYFFFAGVLLIALSELPTFFNIKNYYIDYFLRLPLGGIGVVAFALSIPIQNTSKWLMNICSTSYGIYLSHVVFLEGVVFIFNKLSHTTAVYDVAIKTLAVSIIFISSIIFTLVVRRISKAKEILFGE